MAHISSGSSWQEKARAKRDAVFSLIPSDWRLPGPLPTVDEQPDITGSYLRQFLSKGEIKITETDAADIVKRTSTGQWTAEEVARAFAHRAALAHQLVNCLHEIFFDAAIEDAKGLDAHYAKHKAPVGPLHGLPVSLKDQFHVKGVETHMGYVGWINTFQGETGTGKERVFESEMVKELRSLGAVLYCKTSVPHSLMRGETVNNIVGYTTNPKNRRLASGGSSGGEGALIAAKGSPLGFGTDIGGSIRIPSSFCGLFGLKPSTGRLPYEGMANSMDGQNSVPSVVGPISHSVPSLRLAVKALLSQAPWDYDPLVHNIPWRQDLEQQIESQKNQKGLVFGVFKHDGRVTPWPPIQRAMDDVVERIKQDGHKVIEWDASSHKLAHELISRTWFYDGGLDIHGAFKLSGEEMSEGLMFDEFAAGPGQQFNATEISKVNIAIREFRKEYMERWNATKEMTGTGRAIDGIIAPLAPSPSSEPLRFRYYNYTTWVNLLDYPSCVIPVTTVDEKIDVPFTDFKPRSDIDAELTKDYKPHIFHGAPVSVQVVGRRLQEEKVLAIAEYISSLINS